MHGGTQLYRFRTNTAQRGTEGLGIHRHCLVLERPRERLHHYQQAHELSVRPAMFGQLNGHQVGVAQANVLAYRRLVVRCSDFRRPVGVDAQQYQRLCQHPGHEGSQAKAVRTCRPMQRTNHPAPTRPCC